LALKGRRKKKEPAIVRVAIKKASTEVREFRGATTRKLTKHAEEILKKGYLTCHGDSCIWYPPHRIEQVEIQWDGFREKP